MIKPRRPVEPMSAPGGGARKKQRVFDVATASTRDENALANIAPLKIIKFLILIII